MYILRVASGYFEYSRNERLSVFSFLLLIAVFYSLPTLIRHFSQSPEIDFSEFHAAFEVPEVAVSEFTPQEFSSVSPAPLRAFDPNTATAEELVGLGLKPYLAERIVKYRSKGGRFRKPSDLGKIYGMPKEHLQRLLPYIEIERRNSGHTKPKPIVAVAKRPAESFPFDPNTATANDFQRLGLSERVAGQIVNYRSKGGQFRSPEDFRKIYNLTEADYERLAPLIRIEQTETEAVAERVPKQTSTPKFTPEPKFTGPLEINGASAEEWQQLPGIGPYFAGRIVKYRSALGGFVSAEQVGETYNLPDSTFQKILPYLEVTGAPQKLSLNEATQDELKRHPYLTYRQATNIVRFREQNGPITPISFERLRGPLGKNFDKILPYLSFETAQ